MGQPRLLNILYVLYIKIVVYFFAFVFQEEVRLEQRKRNLLVLIRHYLEDAGCARPSCATYIYVVLVGGARCVNYRGNPWYYRVCVCVWGAGGVRVKKMVTGIPRAVLNISHVGQIQNFIQEYMLLSYFIL